MTQRGKVQTEQRDTKKHLDNLANFFSGSVVLYTTHSCSVLYDGNIEIEKLCMLICNFQKVLGYIDT